MPNMDSTSPSTGEDRTWFEDGIVYTELTHPVTFDSIHRAQDQALEALLQAGSGERVPYIVILTGDAQGEMHLGISELAKMIRHEFTKHITGIWTVGKTEAHTKIVDIVNHYFLSGRVRFADSIEAARTEARQSINDGLGVLEKNK